MIQLIDTKNKEVLINQIAELRDTLQLIVLSSTKGIVFEELDLGYVSSLRDQFQRTIVRFRRLPREELTDLEIFELESLVDAFNSLGLPL